MSRAEHGEKGSPGCSIVLEEPSSAPPPASHSPVIEERGLADSRIRLQGDSSRERAQGDAPCKRRRGSHGGQSTASSPLDQPLAVQDPPPCAPPKAFTPLPRARRKTQEPEPFAGPQPLLPLGEQSGEEDAARQLSQGKGRELPPSCTHRDFPGARGSAASTHPAPAAGGLPAGTAAAPGWGPAPRPPPPSPAPRSSGAAPRARPSPARP